MFKNVETRLLFSPALIKFLATRMVATASIYQKIFWFVFLFDLCGDYQQQDILFIETEQIRIDYHNC